MITLQHLTTGYRLRHRSIAVSQDLCARLPEGKLTCLIGTNGAGKSTLLRTLAGFQSPLDGSVEIDGTPLHELSSQELARTIGIVLTERTAEDGLTVEELVEAGRYPYTGFSGRMSASDRQIVDESLQRTGLTDFRRRPLNTLSDGERQKAMVAKVLAQQTPIILLDEPTAFLDFKAKPALLHLLATLAHEEGKTVLLTTHDLEIALQIADFLWLLTAQGLLADTPRNLSESGDLERCFTSEFASFDRSDMRFKIRDF